MDESTEFQKTLKHEIEQVNLKIDKWEEYADFSYFDTLLHYKMKYVIASNPQHLRKV